MPDENELESTSDEKSGQEIPKPEYSAGSEGVPSSISADEVAKLVLAQIDPRLEEIVNGRVKSSNDKRIGEFNETLSSAEGRLETLKAGLDAVAAGADPKEVFSEAENADLRARLVALESGNSGSSQSSIPGKSAEDVAFDRAVVSIKKFGLENDPAIRTLMGRKDYKDPQDMLDAVNDEILSRSTGKTPPPNPASATGESGKSTSVPEDVDETWSALENANKIGDSKEADKLITQLKEAGVWEEPKRVPGAASAL